MEDEKQESGKEKRWEEYGGKMSGSTAGQYLYPLLVRTSQPRPDVHYV